MSSVTRPRGRLPARVYWARRAGVLAVALGLVFAFVHLLGGGGGGPGRPSARMAGAVVASRSPSPSARSTPHVKQRQPAADPSSATPPSPSASGPTAASTDATPKPTKTPLAIPTGPCRDSDIAVKPTVKGTAHAGSPVVFRLDVSALTSPACTWSITPRTLVVRVTSGSDRIWSTQDCPRVLPPEDLVARKDNVTHAYITWDGQRSDGSCSRSTPWAMPGYYHVTAAAIGANPSDLQFRLYPAVRPTITPSPSPSPSAKPRHRH